MKYILFAFSLSLSIGLSAQTTFSGSVVDVATNEALIGANVVLKQKGVFKTGVSTDFDGEFSLEVDPGVYDVEVSYIGFPQNLISEFVIVENEDNKLNVLLGGANEGTNCYGFIGGCCGGFGGYVIPLIEKDNTTSGKIIDARTIRKIPVKKLSRIVGMTPGISIQF